ncbi:CoA ester lyase [Streptomyces sp. NBC_00237]|uniref:HpcH/HpaI aldolase/citrate lyase family protein n=1 Tax=Streptomyces sp. NBC_00237 TaxID=2975687 RepID=UPI00224E74E1|nr:CoA ester lyase [Streptomyces sp. NBC_00237]MCX5201833.1 CoA ester lyase [Streptomyces sp. NBC_00237]
MPTPHLSPTPLTWLYVPGDRPERVAKALTSGADVVIVDLEDSVAPDRKEYARAATADLLSDVPPTPVHVRLNALGSPLSQADLHALAPCPGLSGLRLPKVTDSAEIRHIANNTPATPLYALIESALGVEHAHHIATAHPCLAGIALGEVDLGADLGVRGEEGLTWARSRIVVAARSAGLPAPAQSVHPDITDLEGLAASCARGRVLGFFGRAALHPRQLPVIERMYLPTPDEVEEAEQTLKAAATEEGALMLPDGRFIDAAVVAAARRTLEVARRDV